MAEYKIKLGVELDTSDLISQINAAESKVDPIKIKVDAETKELTKSIQDALKTLSGGTKNALTLDTSRFEGSIADIKSAVLDLKKTLGTLDDSANMKSLLSSVNQIANAIGKVTDESETLAKSLSVLSKKDFGFNFNLKTGNANPLKAATDYGIEARRKAIPAMKEQVAYLQDMLGGTEKAEKALERYLIKQNKGFGGVTEKNKLQREMLGGTDLDGKTISYNKQMGALEQMVDYYKKIAVESGNSLDGFNAKFSQTAESIVDDTVKIQTGVKQTEEAIEAAANEMKQMFGGGIGAEQLSAQLEPIVSNLNQIREAVQSLSSGVSIDGLTASFDRLSSAIENLLTNAERVKGVLNSGFDNSIVDTSTSSTPSSAVKSAQQTGHQIGETVKQSVKQSLTLDDVIDEQVQNLMNQYGIVGKKGSQAFNEIKQAIVEYRTQLTSLNSAASLNSIDGDFIEIFDDEDAADISKVTSALTSNMKIADQTKEAYEDLAKYIKEINNSGHKIYLPDTIKQEYGEDFSRMRSQLGKAFTTSQSGVDFESWVMELNDQLGNVIDLSHGAEAAFGDLVRKVQMGRDNSYLSGDDLVKSGMLDMDDMEFDIINALGAIEEGERQLAQVSSQTTNAVVQDEERKQQAYRETANEVKKAANSSLSKEADKINKKLIGSDLGASKYDNEIDNVTTKFDKLSNQSDQLKSDMQSLNAAFGNIKAASAANYVESLVSANREYEQVLTRVKNQIDINSRAQKEADAIAKKEASERAKAEKEAAAIASKMQKEADAAAVKETNTELKKLKDLSHQIGQLDFKIVKSDYNGEINQIREFERQLELLKKQYSETVQTLSAKGINIGDIATPEFVEARNKIADFEAQIKDMKAELAQGIKVKLDDAGFNGFVQEIKRVHTATEELEGIYPGLEAALRRLDAAMDEVYAADQAGDVKRLVAANDEYEASLKQVNSQLKLSQQLEEKEYKAEMLSQKKAALSSEMKGWLKENSRAAKDFGEEIRRLDASLDGLDAKGLKLVGQQFKTIKKQAQETGKTGLTAFDKLKTKAKEYATYLSAAEMFMWAEQALRSMFEQVKLIDSAMTELKKVTNESDASYNQFLTNAASRSKVLGTTIDGLVSSTADFARLGYDFVDAQGLAEVANVYAVVGDEVEGVEGATESLISTMAAFNNEMNGMSNADFAMSIADKFNEIGNNFAISSGGVGEALERSASSLNAANNTLDESVALITAAM